MDLIAVVLPLVFGAVLGFAGSALVACLGFAVLRVALLYEAHPWHGLQRWWADAMTAVSAQLGLPATEDAAPPPAWPRASVARELALAAHDVRTGKLDERLPMFPVADPLASIRADPDVRVVLLAARALGEAGRDVLMGHLSHPSRAIRRSVALALAALRDPDGHRAAEPVLTRFVREGDVEVIDALAQMGTLDSIGWLRWVADGSLGLGTARHAKDAITAIHARVFGAELDPTSETAPRPIPQPQGHRQ